MDSLRRSELRRAAASGEAIAAADATRLLDQLDRALRAARIPSEFLVRVARTSDDVDRWEASHPLFGGRRTAAHPADALAFASVELRRVLGEPEEPPEGWDDVRPEITRVVADALAAETAGDAGDALRWSLDELDRRAGELHALRSERWLSARSVNGDRRARERLRRRRVSELTAAGVRAGDRPWDDDGFGPADAVGLALPCLVVALHAERRETFAGWRFSSGREWHALEHRVAPRPMSRYERAVVSPLSVGPEVELALRRLGPHVPDGHSVRDAVAFHELAALELPAVDVGSVAERLSPAWVPLPTASLATLCAGTPDQGLDLDALAASPGGLGPFGGWWRAAWITDDPGPGAW